jgi:hypothetical protein
MPLVALASQHINWGELGELTVGHMAVLTHDFLGQALGPRTAIGCKRIASGHGSLHALQGRQTALREGLIPAAVVVPATIITAVIITLVIVSVSIVAVSVIPVSGPAYYYDGNGFRIRGNQSEQS